MASFEKETSLFTATNFYRWGWPEAYFLVTYLQCASLSNMNRLVIPVERLFDISAPMPGAGVELLL